jgi:hypothetical protein
MIMKRRGSRGTEGAREACREPTRGTASAMRQSDGLFRCAPQWSASPYGALHPDHGKAAAPGAAERRLTRRCQPLAVSAVSGCSTSSPSIMIWISSLTTIRPSRIMLKLRPKSFLLILVVAP